MKCPECGEECTCDEVDIGVGSQQCGPYGCENCGWVQKHDVLIEDKAPYVWRVGDVFVSRENPNFRWRVERLAGTDKALLQSLTTSWACTIFLTYEEWNDRGQWTLEPR